MSNRCRTYITLSGKRTTYGTYKDIFLSRVLLLHIRLFRFFFSGRRWSRDSRKYSATIFTVQDPGFSPAGSFIIISSRSLLASTLSLTANKGPACEREHPAHKPLSSGVTTLSFPVHRGGFSTQRRILLHTNGFLWVLITSALLATCSSLAGRLANRPGSTHRGSLRDRGL